jgi:hypothetical protein
MAPLILKRELFALKNENVKDDLMSKKGKKEFQRVSHTLN